MMHRFSLHSPLQAWKPGDYPLSPFVHLSLGTYIEDQGRTLLSAQLMTEQEIDEVLRNLKAELDEFGKLAKNELRDLRSKIRG